MKKLSNYQRGNIINIKSASDDGTPYPNFLLQHISTEWADVGILEIDPDICLRVDSSLSYCGCIHPDTKIRRYMYSFQNSDDFDYETVSLIIRITRGATADSWVWIRLLSVELERDCGLTRENYIQSLESIANKVETDLPFCDDLLTA